MSKYSYEEKLEVVLGVVEKGLSHQASANIIGACKADAQKWVKLYKGHGVEGLKFKKGSYDGKFKISVIEYMHKNHLSIRETAAKFGIASHTTVGQWERIYYEEGLEALIRNNRRSNKKMTKLNKPRNPKLDKKLEEDLIAETQRLRMENAYLKKLQALIQERIQRQNWKK